MELVSSKQLSPAKINLMLRVVGQRKDGYHELQTCFQLLDWGDVITFKPLKSNGANKIEIEGFGDLPTEDNLIYHAAQMIKPWAQNHSDWVVQVEKNIPCGAGLGGGSSNAAMVLKFFNTAWQCDLSMFDLLAMAAKLGADVPVFVLGQSALAAGIGDRLEPMQFNTPYVLLLFPECHINTAELFRSPNLVRDQSPLKVSEINQTSYWINDFMPVVIQQFPKVNAIYHALKSQMSLRLSGSGSTLFALFDDLNSAEEAKQKAAEICDVKLTQPLNARYSI